MEFLNITVDVLDILIVAVPVILAASIKALNLYMQLKKTGLTVEGLREALIRSTRKRGTSFSNWSLSIESPRSASSKITIRSPCHRLPVQSTPS